MMDLVACHTSMEGQASTSSGNVSILYNKNKHKKLLLVYVGCTAADLTKSTITVSLIVVTVITLDLRVIV